MIKNNKLNIIILSLLVLFFVNKSIENFKRIKNTKYYIYKNGKIIVDVVDMCYYSKMNKTLYYKKNDVENWTTQSGLSCVKRIEDGKR